MSEVVKKQIAASQKWTCWNCADMLRSSFEIDHTIPLWKDGFDEIENMRALCSNCHSQKAGKLCASFHARDLNALPSHVVVSGQQLNAFQICRTLSYDASGSAGAR